MIVPTEKQRSQLRALCNNHIIALNRKRMSSPDHSRVYIDHLDQRMREYRTLRTIVESLPICNPSTEGETTHVDTYA